MNQYTVEDIYSCYLKEKAKFFCRPYKLPTKKPFELFFQEKPQKQQDIFYKLTERFNTVWLNIDPSLYFASGFKLFGKSFYYNRFFEPSILTKCRRTLLQKSLSDENVEEETKEALKWIYKYIKKNKFNSVKEYFSYKEGYMPLFLSHYVKGYINNVVLAWVWINHKEWFKDIDDDLFMMYAKPFRKNVYKHINTLLNNRKLAQLIEIVFSKKLSTV